MNERAVVVAQLVERSLPRSEIHGSNVCIGKNFLVQLYIRKDKNKEKEVGNGPFKKNNKAMN